MNPLHGTQSSFAEASRANPLLAYDPSLSYQQDVSDFDPGAGSLPIATLQVLGPNQTAAPSAQPTPSSSAATITPIAPSDSNAPAPGAPGGPRWGPAVTGAHIVGGPSSADQAPAPGSKILSQLIAHAAARGHNLLSPSTPQEANGRGILGAIANLLGIGSHTDENGNTIRGGHITWPAGFGPNKGLSAFGFTDENGDYHTNMQWDQNAGTYVIGAHRVYTTNARTTPDGDVVYVDANGKPGAVPQDSPEVIAARTARNAILNQPRYPASWQNGIGVGTRFIPQQTGQQ